MDDLDKILEPFGEKLVEDLKKSLKAKEQARRSQLGSRAGSNPGASKLSAKITFNITFGDPLHFQLIMPEYAEAVDGGRSKTSKGGGGNVKKEVEAWVKRKGVVDKSDLYKDMKSRKITTRAGKVLNSGDKRNRAAKQLAFLISRKIHREGFKGNHFYTEIIRDGRVKQLEAQLRDYFKKEVIIDILQ